MTGDQGITRHRQIKFRLRRQQNQNINNQAIAEAQKRKMVIALYIAFITYSVPLCLVCATVPRTYTNEWAVKLSGGRDSADEIASKHGFVNCGLVRRLSACVSVFLCDLARLSIAAPQVAGLSDVYLFALRNHPDRSTSPFADKSTLVIAENGVSVL